MLYVSCGGVSETQTFCARARQRHQPGAKREEGLAGWLGWLGGLPKRHRNPEFPRLRFTRTLPSTHLSRQPPLGPSCPSSPSAPRPTIRPFLSLQTPERGTFSSPSIHQHSTLGSLVAASPLDAPLSPPRPERASRNWETGLWCFWSPIKALVEVNSLEPSARVVGSRVRDALGLPREGQERGYTTPPNLCPDRKHHTYSSIRHGAAHQRPCQTTSCLGPGQ